MDSAVEAIRGFNRFYTKQIGVLQEGMLDSPFSLTEMRVLYELAHTRGLTATALGKELGLDQGYLSRILRGFEGRGLIVRTPSAEDGRQHFLELTEAAVLEFGRLNERQNREVEAMMARLSEAEKASLISSMGEIRRVLGDRPESNNAYLLRDHQPGDMGWVVYRHGVLYAQEYGYDHNFEALVAEIVAKFLREFDPKRDRCWIAEKDAQVVGSVFVVRETDEIAKLRLLLVEPSARGLGIGASLVEECLRFARQAGYKKMALWTHKDLTSARNIYEKAGFRLAETTTHHDFGLEQVAETWAMDL